MALEFFFTKLTSDVTELKNLKENGSFHELEIRFGQYSHHPHAQYSVPKNIWDTIFETCMVNYVVSKVHLNDYIFYSNQARVIHRNQFGKTRGIISGDVDSNVSDKHFPPQKPVTSISYVKQKVKNVRVDIFRYSHSLETEIEFHPPSTPASQIRVKQRFSRLLNDCVRLDMTRVDVYNSQGEWNRVEHQIELEAVVCGTELLDAFKHATTYINAIYQRLVKPSLRYEMQSLMQPVNVTIQDIEKLQFAYAVTEKADGIRALLIVADDQAVLKNTHTHTNIWETKAPSGFEGTVMDCEWIPELQLLLGFDVLFYCGTDVRFKSLRHRLVYLENFAIPGIRFQSKEFHFDNIDSMALEVLESKFEYEVDGLIFTPIQGRYDIFASERVLKWKPHVTIDVRCEYSESQDFTFFHHSTTGRYSKPWNKDPNIMFLRWSTTLPAMIQLFEEHPLGKLKKTSRGRMTAFLGVAGKLNNIECKTDICEFRFTQGLGWVFFRKRPDKTKPNSWRTINALLKLIAEPVTINALTS